MDGSHFLSQLVPPILPAASKGSPDALCRSRTLIKIADLPSGAICQKMARQSDRLTDIHIDVREQNDRAGWIRANCTELSRHGDS